MQFDIVILFPEIFSGYLTQSLLKLAIDRGLVRVHTHNLRDWALGKHHQVDDRPYGGGPGMVLMVEPVVAAVEQIATSNYNQSEVTPASAHVVMLTPQVRRLTQRVVEELATHRQLVLLCGRYEGFDDRVRQVLQPDEISVGDFVLNGGEVAAMVLVDAVVRLVPGVLGDEQSHKQDSFSTDNRLLEGPQFTRPREFRGLMVPEVLLGGNHEEIARWRNEQSLQRTRERRADLLESPGANDED